MKASFCLALTMLVCFSLPGYRRPKPHYTFVLPDQYVGWVQVIFSDPEAPHLPIQKDEGRVIGVPESGIPRTSDLQVIDARARDEFYYRVLLPGGRTALQGVPETYILPGPTHGGFSMKDTDGKGRGSSWYLFIGSPELRAKVPNADWDKVVEDYAKIHGGKKRIESSGPYPTAGRMALDELK